LFAGTNAAGKSFINQQKDAELYYFFLASPTTIFTARWLNNLLSMFLVASVHILGLLVFFNNPINNLSNFAISVVLGIIGFSLAFTLIAAIASKAQSSALLMSLLSFPVVIPQLILLIKISNRAIIGLDFNRSYNDVVVLSAIIAIIGALSYILFPLVWKD
jgi:heme exporter protein B